MTPGQVNFTIYRGATFADSFTLLDEAGVALNLTGKKARMQARTELSDALPVVTWSSVTGELVITPLAGKVTFNVAASVTAALGSDLYSYEAMYYDVELFNDTVSPETVERVIQGCYCWYRR